MSEGKPDIVDWALFEKNRTELGPGFIRILSYFREDGAKSLEQIEQAMHSQNTTALVIPLKNKIAGTIHPGPASSNASRVTAALAALDTSVVRGATNGAVTASRPSRPPV